MASKRNKKPSRQKVQKKDLLFQCLEYRKLILERGKGVWVWDTKNKKYLDLMSGQFSLPLGYGNREFTALIAKQLNKISHANNLYLSEEVFDGAQALASVTARELNKVTFISTGAEAVEFALRYAKKYTGKDGVAAVRRGYHGLTLAAQTITHAGIYARPKVPFSYHLPTPLEDCLESRDPIKACLKESDRVLERAREKLAAIVVEPIISVGGMIYPPRQYFQGLKQLAKKHRALLIFDECQTGLGRTGKWFGYNWSGVVPDMLILAKGAGLGLPTSAVVMKERIGKALAGKLQHYSSHQNDPVSGVSVKFLIDFIKKEKMLDHVKEVGDYLVRELKSLSRDFPILENPRGRGLMAAFSLSEKLFKKNQNPGQDLISLMEERDVLTQAVRRGRVIRILPAYIITEKEIDFFVRALRDSLTVLEKRYKK